MSNALWRLNGDYLAAYTEIPEVMAKVKRSYHDFIPMAYYYRDGKLIAMQYRVPSKRKRSARHLLGVSVAR